MEACLKIFLNSILFLINPCKFFFLEEHNIKKKINGYIDRESSQPDQKPFSLSDTLLSQPIVGSSRKKNLQGLAS